MAQTIDDDLDYRSLSYRIVSSLIPDGGRKAVGCPSQIINLGLNGKRPSSDNHFSGEWD